MLNLQESEKYLCIQKYEYPKWKCIYFREEDPIKKKLDEWLENEDTRIIDANEVEWYITAVKNQKNIKDSRIESDGFSKDLKWIVLSPLKTKCIENICEMILNELTDRIESFVQLDEVSKQLEDFVKLKEIAESSSLNKEKETFKAIIKYKSLEYFLENIINYDLLIQKYINQVVTKYKLPDIKILIQISGMFYESRTIKTKIYFYTQNLEDKNIYKIKFEGKPETRVINLSNLRTIRKLMEISGKNALYAESESGDSDSYIIKGIGNIVKDNAEGIADIVKDNAEGIAKSIADIIKDNAEGIIVEDNADLVCVDFIEHLTWQVKKGQNIIFSYKKGEYLLPELLYENPLEQELEKIKDKEFCGCKMNDKYNKINNILKLLKEYAKHGTSIIFMAKEYLGIEIDRLTSYNKAYKIKEFDMVNG